MVKRSRVLHIWDYRVSSGNNIDDLFLDAEFDNISIARVLASSKNNRKTPIDFLLKIRLKKCMGNENRNPTIPANLLVRVKAQIK